MCAWPSASARTKTWGTEILTSGDLDGQFDILHQYNNDQLNGTSGHTHSGGTSSGPQIPLTTSVTGILPAANGGTSNSSYTIGDVLSASASTTLSKVSPSSAGQALSSAGAATLPIFSGMTTQGDVEFHNGTNRTRLAAGISGQVLQTQGASSNPQWATVRGYTFASTVVFNSTAPTTSTVLDLSSNVGSNLALVMLKVVPSVHHFYTFGTNGDTISLTTTTDPGGIAKIAPQASNAQYVFVQTDSAGKIIWMSDNTDSVVIFLLGYFK